MKNIIFILAIALATVSNAQSLNSILDGVYAPTEKNALSTPLLLSMKPQNGIPHEVLVILVVGMNPDSIFGDVLDPNLGTSLETYTVFHGADVLALPLFEKGIYTILCLDEDGNNVGEGVHIVVNENFIQGVIDTGYAEKRSSLIVSTRPLRIGLDRTEFVSFN